MNDLPEGEYLLTDVQWRRRERDEALRPLHGFTTGNLRVDGGNANAQARFNDQFLSNRFSDLDQDGIPIVLVVAVLETEQTYTLSCSAPTLDRAGASYQLQAEGDFVDANVGSSA